LSLGNMTCSEPDAEKEAGSCFGATFLGSLQETLTISRRRRAGSRVLLASTCLVAQSPRTAFASAQLTENPACSKLVPERLRIVREHPSLRKLSLQKRHSENCHSHPNYSPLLRTPTHLSAPPWVTTERQLTSDRDLLQSPI